MIISPRAGLRVAAIGVEVFQFGADAVGVIQTARVLRFVVGRAETGANGVFGL